MNKLKQSMGMLGIIVTALTFPAQGQAVDFTIGAQAWNENLKIDASYKDSTNYFNSDHDYKPVIWAEIEHGISYLPNLKLRYTDLERNSGSTISGSIKIDDVVYTDQTYVRTKTTLTHFDITPYYNVLSSEAFNLALGLDFKAGHFKIKGWADAITSEVEAKGVLPLPYAATQINLPGNIFIKGDIAGFAIKDYSIYDYEFSVGWTAIDTDVIDAAIEAGYRKFYVAGEDIEDLDAHIKADGFFAGLSFTY